MRIIETELPGVRIIEPCVFSDGRGFLLEAYSARRYREEAGITQPFVQQNISHSHQDVLRGLHFQRMHPQGKLIQVTAGAIYDVAVDIDPHSPTFGHYTGIELSAANHRQLWIPPGYAHGFCVLSKTADVGYHCTGYYDPDDEGGLAWNCPEIGIRWPISRPVLSERDHHHPGLSAVRLAPPGH